MRLISLLEKKGNSNATEATLQLVKRLNVPVTATTITETLESHPYFPSLLSISDSLYQWKVENAAFEVEESKLEELPTPFIAHSSRGGGNFVLVNSVNGSVELVNEIGRQETLSREAFVKEWTRTVLLVEKNISSGEDAYKKKKKEEWLNKGRMPLLFIIGFLFTIGSAITHLDQPFGLAASLLLLLKLVGCMTAGFLLWFEIDKNNPVVQQICTGGSNTNCTAILSSKASKLFDWLSWSEVGFFYFAGSFLALLFTSTLNFTFYLICWLNLFTLPYTAFSLHYQWRIAKQWCPLCLAVQGLLVLEAAIAFFSYWRIGSLPSPAFFSVFGLPVAAAFALPVLFWVAVKGVYLSEQAGRKYKKEWGRLKHNKEIFTALLQQQKHVELNSVEGLGITIGNPNASTTLIKVCSPFCGPCGRAHALIEELLAQRNDLKVQIIFATANDDSASARVVKHLMALYAEVGEKSMQEALDHWYSSETKDYIAFADLFPVSERLEVQGEKLGSMKAWCNATGISFTPTFFLNGYQLPEQYKIDEVKLFLAS